MWILFQVLIQSLDFSGPQWAHQFMYTYIIYAVSNLVSRIAPLDRIFWGPFHCCLAYLLIFSAFMEHTSWFIYMTYEYCSLLY